MKITVNVDCTPLEAREFMGLPNIQPMQEVVMKKLEEQMLENIGQMSPDAILRNWMSFAPEQFQEILKMTFGAAAGAGSKSSK
jgi:hypothetical protein